MEHHHPKKTTRLPKKQSHESSFSAEQNPTSSDFTLPKLSNLGIRYGRNYGARAF